MKAIGVIFLVLIALIVAGLRVNIMPSVAHGIYWLTTCPATVERGMLVTVHTSETRRLMRDLHGWLASWMLPIMKPIAALPGDQVCLVDGTLHIVYGSTTEVYGPVLTNGRGQSLPTWIDTRCRVIPDGHVFLASKAVQSIDSRYFGPINMTDIRSRAVPLVTW
jgi:conjugative transfer signal peptidase TraF